jgi:hypothetical protein
MVTSRRLFAAFASTVSLGFFSAPSTAAVVSGTWSFSATGAVGAENVVFEGSFTTSFDNSASATLNPADITVNALNLLPGFTGTVGASYLQASDALIFGYTIAGAGGLTAATNDFRIIFSPSAAPSNDTFVYTRAGAKRALQRAHSHHGLHSRRRLLAPAALAGCGFPAAGRSYATGAIRLRRGADHDRAP